MDDNGLQTDRIAFEVVNTLATASLVDLRISMSGLAAGAEVRFEPGALERPLGQPGRVGGRAGRPAARHAASRP